MSQRPPLEAVLFDAGGTLIRLDFEWMTTDLAAHGVVTDAGALRVAETTGRRAYDESAGMNGPAAAVRRGDVRAYFGVTLLAAGVPDDQVAPAVERFIAREKSSGLWCRPMEGARQALDRIRALGLRTAVVSNSDGRAALHLSNAGMLEGIEFVVDSHEVGIEKPDPAIFGLALKRLGTAPARTLFVGDIRSVDEVGARAAGIPFVLLDAVGDYASPGSPSIAGMSVLADWVTEHFDVSRSESSEPGGTDRRAIGGTG